MGHMIMTFLTWDLAIACALMLVLMVIVVLQKMWDVTAGLLQRPVPVEPIVVPAQRLAADDVVAAHS